VDDDGSTRSLESLDYVIVPIVKLRFCDIYCRSFLTLNTNHSSIGCISPHLEEISRITSLINQKNVVGPCPHFSGRKAGHSFQNRAFSGYGV